MGIRKASSIKLSPRSSRGGFKILQPKDDVQGQSKEKIQKNFRLYKLLSHDNYIIDFSEKGRVVHLKMDYPFSEMQQHIRNFVELNRRHIVDPNLDPDDQYGGGDRYILGPQRHITVNGYPATLTVKFSELSRYFKEIGQGFYSPTFDLYSVQPNKWMSMVRDDIEQYTAFIPLDDYIRTGELVFRGDSLEMAEAFGDFLQEFRNAQGKMLLRL